MSIEIKTLVDFDNMALQQIISGYTSDFRYTVHWAESDTYTTFTLEITPLDQPFVKHYEHLDDETLRRYREVLKHGLSFGAYDGEGLVGVVLAEPYDWNASVWVWEFHVGESYRGKGIGQALMDRLVKRSREVGARVIVCETQTTNVPAIRFYRSIGFWLEGIDLSYYSNTDWPDGEVAVFMKRRLLPESTSVR